MSVETTAPLAPMAINAFWLTLGFASGLVAHDFIKSLILKTWKHGKQ